MSIAATLDQILEAIELAAPVVALRESTFVYPLVNSLHIVGIALLFGAIVALDVRLIGWRRTAGPADRLETLLLPVALTGMALAIPMGLLLFATDARAYTASSLFQAKILLIALALGNALWLRMSDRRGPGWRRRSALAAAASIVLWLGAILLGRMVGYF